MTKKKILFIVSAVILAPLVFVFLYFFAGSAPREENVLWGVNFSQKHALYLGLDWKETYAAILDDLGARRVKVAAHWDLLEMERDHYSFDDLDWQMGEAGKRGAEVLMVVGMKTPRWPECHIPNFALSLSKEEAQQEILEMLEAVVERYKNHPALLGWQVENEPFFPFGECPWADGDFLKKEVELVKSLDPSREIVVTASGEGSLGMRAAKTGDKVGTTLYRKVWSSQLGTYLTWPYRPVFYWRKALLLKALYGKETIGVELQAEPWGQVLLYDLPLEEQEKTMNLERFKGVIEYAKNTGLKEQYLWGTEWWYWMKEKQNNPVIWNEAKSLF
ncbi:MAG: beta-galactosidase [bacterium]|nr:beta-galactosidase [bacterium]